MDCNYHSVWIVFAGFFVLTRGQAINQPPTWVSDSYSILTRGISENTQIGTSLIQLSCTDPENDPVVYAVQSGGAVDAYRNGTVVLFRLLEFETSDPVGLDLTFTCTDVNKNGVNLHTPVPVNVQLSVLDFNDNRPIFQVNNTEGYAFTIPEDATIGTVVEDSIRTIDKDRTANAALRNMYLICDSPNATERANLPDSSVAMCQKFVLTYYQIAEGIYGAKISLKDSLDYENRSVYISKIVAIDGPGVSFSFTSTVNVQINILDRQDMPPVFTNERDFTFIMENATVGTVVANFGISARDGDTGDRRQIMISMYNDSKNAFNLTTAVEVGGTGVYSSKLIIKNQLDRETNIGGYLFVVKATEIDKVTNQTTTATATATYSVSVIDVNDNGPKFLNETYWVNITEIDRNINRNSSLQITGLHIICWDPDEPTNAMYKATIVQQTIGTGANAINVTDAYSISPRVDYFTGNGSMFLIVDNPKYLDYDVEAYRVHTVVIVAREIGTAELFSSSTTVSIFLRDLNDNAPVFNNQSYVIKVRENVIPPMDLLTVHATDKDFGDNGRVFYQLEGGFSGKFSIDNNTGVLRLVQPLNYEEASEYAFLVQAVDFALEPRISQVQVTVYVLNYNDVPPRFRQSQYQTSVNESSLNFLNPVTVSAVDDEVDSGNITYRIVSGQNSANSFVLNPTTGVLTLRSFLDFTDTPLNAFGVNSGVYTLVVEASDNGEPPLTATVKVNVTVIDENNHPPMLIKTNYRITLNETDKEGTFVTQINATDEDAGDNGKISYRLGAGATDNFAVDESTGIVTVGPAPFDYDVQNKYILLIVAADGGAPQKFTTATVTIDIQDRNNKDPFFTEKLYMRTIDDREPVGTSVLMVQGTDLDSTRNLDYRILQNFIATNPSGSQIISTYPYDYTKAFGVNSSGIIYIMSSLDHKMMEEITFSLEVYDKNTEAGAGTGTTQITIIVKGEVDQSIKFDTVREIFMNEDAKPGYVLLTLTARDANNQPIRDYREIIDSVNFSVDRASGQLILFTQIDYENDNPNHLHTVVIGAYSSNGLSSATVTVTVSIVDVNDNVPEFEPRIYSALVSETAVYPTFVVNIYATDKDSTSYGPLNFTLNGLDADDFEIFHDSIPAGSKSSRSGQVIVAKGKKLDYNHRSEYDLTIVATDNMDMRFSSIHQYGFAQLQIQVIDENNHDPLFKESVRSLAISETTDIGRSIATLVATDEDKGRNGEIVYSLIPSAGDNGSPPASSLFTIGSQSGIVSVAQSLIGQGNRKFSIEVMARDRGDMPKSGRMNLIITVLSTEDTDGFPKWFTPPNGYVLMAPENTAPYLIVDSATNSSRFFSVNPRTGTNITYSISPYSESADSFQIDRITGEITIIKKLDREIQETYKLLIYAEDTYDPQKYRTGRQLYVKLWDLDDNVATFTNPNNYSSCVATPRPFTIRLKENTGANFTVATVKACDPDSKENAIIIYQLYNDIEYCSKGNAISPLMLMDNGDLVTTRNIDYEQDREFIMCILAQSKGSSSGRRKRSFDMNQITYLQDNVTYVEIIIEDENDNGPKFPSPTAVGIVQTDPGTAPILTLNAVDVDGLGYNVTNYRIESSVFYPQGDVPPSPFIGAFNLRGERGVIYAVLPSYHAYSGGHFELKVVATDNSDATKSDSQTVTIYVFEKGQAAKVILGLKPEDGTKYGQTIVNQLDDISQRYRFVFLRVSEHATESSVDLTKTDVCFLAVDENTKDVLSLRQMFDLLIQDRYSNVLRTVDYHFLDQGECYPTPSSESNIKWRNLWWVLVAIAIFIFVCCVILIVLVCILYDRYKRYMETRKTYLVSQ